MAGKKTKIGVRIAAAIAALIGGSAPVYYAQSGDPDAAVLKIIQAIFERTLL